MAWAAAAIPAVAGLIGNDLSANDRNEALKIQKEALENIKNINTPDIRELRIALERYQSAGEVAPQMQSLIHQGDTSMNDIAVDPRLKAAQMQSLLSMQRGGVEGLRPEDEALLSRIRSNNETDAQARDQAIRQNMQERGGWDTGSEIAARLIASQGAANRAGQQGLDVGAQASQAALQNIISAGSLGGQMNAQDFSQQAQTAQARDVIKNYNAINSQQVGNQNIALANAAQAQNLANRQNVANQNVGLSNQQEMFNKSLPQLDFQNKISKATGQIGPSGSYSAGLNANAAGTAAAVTGVGQSIGQGIAATDKSDKDQQYLDYLKTKPTNVAPRNPNSF